MQCVRKYGVNFFDNAESYGNPRGLAETNFGKALKLLQQQDSVLWRRSELVITTKIFFGTHPENLSFAPTDMTFGVNEMGLTRKHLFEGMRASLQRMQLDYVDIVYAHRPDALTSVEQIVRSFHDIIEKGYAFHWGTSMWKPVQIVEAYYIAKMNNLHAPVIEQPCYSMFTRDVVENEYLDVFKAPYNVGCTIWNVLDRGILSGKYNRGLPRDARLSGKNRLGAFVGHSKYVTRDKIEKVERLMPIANELNVSMVELAIGWCLKNPNVTVCILGASKMHQLEQAMGSIQTANKLDNYQMERIEKILNNKPKRKELDRPWRVHQKKIISRL